MVCNVCNVCNVNGMQSSCECKFDPTGNECLMNSFTLFISNETWEEGKFLKFQLKIWR